MAAYQSNGFIFKKETVTPGTYASVTQCIKVTPPKYERNTQEVYTTDSASPTIIYSTLKAQEVEATFLYDPASVDHEAFRTDLTAKTSRNYQIIYPDTGAYEVKCNMTPTSVEYSELDGEGSAIQMTVKFTLNSAPTITP